jgi:nucleotide-binding universal stress UspA family protein
MQVKKIIRDGGMKREISKRLRRRPHDILVMGMKVSSGLSGLFGNDITDYLVQYFRQTTLYLPDEAKPFVDEETGNVTFRSIVVPVVEFPAPESSLHLLQRLLRLFPDQSPKVYGLHIGEIFPYISAATLEGLSWIETTIASGTPSQAIASFAREKEADLIIMTTNGRDTFQQKIIGSVTEQVLKAAPCPVLAVAVE